MTNLHYETAVSLRGRILARTLSSVELCRHLLDRIAAANSRLGAFVAVDRDDVLRQAEAADRRVAAGAETGLLAGLPVVVKDMIATAGLETTCGSRVLRGYVPPRDAYVVRRIREEGGVVLGKTSMDEFGMGSSNEHCAAGPCGNPDRKSVV